ncbi:glycerol dehydrogenase [Aureimonas fodinaquatilis]|uniref:Glycerol dehydrogenase n=1 Tax=Aureimonas fodinaquatilis TaxID=2565783 RepID=A0A5B0DRN1_9HYPH|nr:glycerol dehydrogenase [Aureimonas fodinaquatilis]KAA0969457.1 glycerol dehydrogenase [Aureimonas fodinaquatilis]
MTIRILGAPQRYVQGPGAIDRLAEEVAIFGSGPVAVIIDPVARQLLGERILQLLPQARLLEFGGECTAGEIDARAAETQGAAIILGVGGGKAIDTAKGAAIISGLPVGIVPTIASNDSPTSHIAVVYTPDHAVEGVRRMRTNPALVLVDTAIIAGAPRRFLAAGIGDAMSKPYELAGAVAGKGLNFFGGQPTELTLAIVERARAILLADGLAAMAATKPNEAFERVVEAAVLLSGLAFESGGLSIAHSMVRGFSTVPQLSGLLHGEMVALGTLTQIAAGQGDEAELGDLAQFLESIGLPTRFAPFGITDEATFRRMAEVALGAPYASNYYRSLEPDDLVRAMQLLNERI